MAHACGPWCAVRTLVRLLASLPAHAPLSSTVPLDWPPLCNRIHACHLPAPWDSPFSLDCSSLYRAHAQCTRTAPSAAAVPRLCVLTVTDRAWPAPAIICVAAGVVTGATDALVCDRDLCGARVPVLRGRCGACGLQHGQCWKGRSHPVHPGLHAPGEMKKHGMIRLARPRMPKPCVCCFVGRLLAQRLRLQFGA